MERYIENELASSFKELKVALKDDRTFLKMKPIESMQKSIDVIGSIYVKYLKVVNSLTEAHNGLINPIKRQSLQVIIEKLFGRILELKFEMVDVEKADFQYLDNIILQNYVTRKHVEMKIPHYLRDQRHDLLSSLYERMAQIEYRKEHPEEFMEREESEEIEERRSSLGRASAMRRTSLIGSATSEPDDGSKIKESRMSSLRDTRRQQSVTAVASKRPPVVTKIEDKFEFYDELTLLQRHERARFGRLKTHRVKEELRILHDKAYLIHKEVPDDIALKAAETIQSFYMTYKNKQWRRYLNTYKGLKYGTLMPSYRDRTVINEITKLLEERKKIQKHFETEMVKKEKEISENMQRVKKYEIMEDMVTELRAFIRAWYDYTKAFGYTEVPEWPGEEEVIPPARFLGIPEGLPKYYVNANFPEIDYAKIGLHPVLPLVGSELITAGFWIPVEQYAPAAEMERNILAKGIPKEDEEKNAQEKESEKEREEQRKEEERLKMEELMRRGHVPAKSNYLKDIIALSGEFIQYWSVGTVYTQAEDEINMLERIKSKVIYEVTREVRKDVDNQMRKELKILKAAIEKDTLEMGEPVLKIKRKKKKEKKKKAKKVKKDPLAERTVESLFDELTEEGLIIRCKPIIIDSLTGQYNFHAQEARLKYENPVPAMGDVYQVAKAYEPTVIFIEGAEKPFYKKVPKNEKAMRPGALKGVVPKLLKAIKNVDRIMVLATAEFPWMSKPKLASVYQKVLICPESDYHCVSALVQKTILSNHGVDRQFDTSVPSAFFQGMPLNEIEDKLKAIFTVERRIRLAYNPLKIEELGCIDKEAPKDRNLEDWYNKFYPLNKGRKKMLDGEREKRERELKLKENAEKRKALSAGKAV
ncbi:dynein regulatory complex protein 11 isoform X3 [Halyomorpha halys]|uniref:dynein regulatory complex protein 11 isoform X3 n=1 Tax=Halyomorpha halys TaxID=286706 RepID=UPI0006D52522|nr:IQ and AAA domain-containing protein 1-like isoform X3 [Halyomorpha halys]